MTIELKPEAIEGKARMTDDELVKRLREAERGAKKDSREEVLFVEAADAIEQLTRERDEALRRRIVYSPDAKALSDRAEAAERKVEKLREALLKLITLIDASPQRIRSGAGGQTVEATLAATEIYTRVPMRIAENARAALAETENNDD